MKQFDPQTQRRDKPAGTSSHARIGKSAKIYLQKTLLVKMMITFIQSGN